MSTARRRRLWWRRVRENRIGRTDCRREGRARESSGGDGWQQGWYWCLDFHRSCGKDKRPWLWDWRTVCFFSRASDLEDRGSNLALTGWYSRFRTMEAASNRLQKESKGYLDSLRGVQFSPAFELELLMLTFHSHDCFADAYRRDNRCILRWCWDKGRCESQL